MQVTVEEMPHRSRAPLPKEIMAAIVQILLFLNRREHAIAVFLMFVTYCRPGEILSLTAKQLLAGGILLQQSGKSPVQLPWPEIGIWPSVGHHNPSRLKVAAVQVPEGVDSAIHVGPGGDPAPDSPHGSGIVAAD